MTDQPEEPLDDLPVPPVPSADEVAAELEEVEEEGRRYPSTIGGAFYLLVLVTAIVGVGIVWAGNWRLGVRCLAGALLVAAVMRLVLPAKDAGMLAVRHRAVDCVLLAGLGGALVFLAQTIPNQPGF